MAGLISDKDKKAGFGLNEQSAYRWLALYRGLAILPATISLFLPLSSSDRKLEGALYALAWVNLLLQTLLYFHSELTLHRARGSKQFTGIKTLARPYLVTLSVLELLIGVLLNGLGNVDVPLYYLFSLAAIFQSALFFGLRGARLATTGLTGGYLAALIATVALTGNTPHWLIPVILVTGFVITGGLSGYLAALSGWMSGQVSRVSEYRAILIEQNRLLQQAHRRLDYLSYFSQALQEGTTPGRVEQLALHYLSRFLEETRIWRLGELSRKDSVEQGAQFLKGEEAEAWLRMAQPGSTSQNSSGRVGSEVVTVRKNNQIYWLARVVYKEEQFGVLVIPSTPGPVETEEKLLLSLLADQTARVLGGLKQSQALAVEAERARLAMDMHDVVIQSLFGIALNLNASVRLLDKDPSAARQRLADLQNLAFETLNNVRSIIYDLWNDETSQADFAKLAQTYLEKAGKLYPFGITLEIRDQSKPRQGFGFAREVQKSLYRVLQEALSNVAKHSGADEVYITLVRAPHQVELEIRDNGRGFDKHQIKTRVEAQSVVTSPAALASGGLGLNIMRERLEQQGGKLVIESKPGEGTRLLATIPVHNFSPEPPPLIQSMPDSNVVARGA